MAGNEKVSNVVLWGASQSGKSTALATYLYHLEQDWIDYGAAETKKTLIQLSETWNNLRKNRLPGTTIEGLHYEIRHRNGQLIRFRDMRGGATGSLISNQIDADALASADAVMMFVEWPGQRAVLDGIAVDGFRKLKTANRPMAFVVTKVESALSPSEFLYFANDPLKGARRLNLPQSFIDLLAAWPRKDMIFSNQCLRVYWRSLSCPLSR